MFQSKWKKCCCGESETIHRLDGPCYRIEQKPDPCTHDYGVLRVGCMPWCKGKPDPVEEKIQEIAKEGNPFPICPKCKCPSYSKNGCLRWQCGYSRVSLPEGKHSPLPWKIDEHTGGEIHLFSITNEYLGEIGDLADDKAYQNAIFIIKAVNLHAKLVEALEELVTEQGTGIPLAVALHKAKALLREAAK